MFSFFNKKNKQIHPLFGPLSYRQNRGKSKSTIPGFWEGSYALKGEDPARLLVWGGRENGPHAKQAAIFETISNNIEDYIQRSKKGLLDYIKAEEEAANGEVEADDLVFDLENPQVIWTLDQLYFQDYPMSERLKADLAPQYHDGVAWGFCFKVSGAYEGEGCFVAYSAFVDLELHPVFPFTYH